MNAKKINPNDAPVKVVKVKPYPFPAEIFKQEGAPPSKVKILRLTEIGFLLRAEKDQFFKVGQNLSIRFFLPVLHRTITTSVKVIKTYDILDQQISGALEKRYTVEMHFRGLETEHKQWILDFIAHTEDKKK